MNDIFKLIDNRVDSLYGKRKKKLLKCIEKKLISFKMIIVKTI